MHGQHAVHSFNGLLDELGGIGLNLETRTLANVLPQRLKRRVHRNGLLQLDRNFLGLVADLQLLRLAQDDRLDLLLRGCELEGSSTLPSSAAAFGSGVAAPLASIIPVAARCS